MKNKKKVIGNTVFFFALFGLTAYAVLKGKELSELAEVLKSVKPAYYCGIGYDRCVCVLRVVYYLSHATAASL